LVSRGLSGPGSFLPLSLLRVTSMAVTAQDVTSTFDLIVSFFVLVVDVFFHVIGVCVH